MKYVIVISVFFILANVSEGYASSGDREEPEMAELERALSPRDFGIRHGIGFRLHLNNFGFGVGGEYRRILSRHVKGIFELQISNVKDDSEQSFQNFWGQMIIPNKYNRILAFPALFGVKRRVFADQISDNFRLFVQASGGPSPAFVYPYFNDLGYGFRLPQQRNYDPFQGWGDGEFVMGGTGHFSIGANIGGDFANIQSVQIGYFFHYYPGGIQVMEPKRPGPEFNKWAEKGVPPSEFPPEALESAADKQAYFGTPHITFVFGSMW